MFAKGLRLPTFWVTSPFLKNPELRPPPPPSPSFLGKIFRLISNLKLYIYVKNIISIHLSIYLSIYLFWPWLSPLRGWGSLTMALTGKFVYVYIWLIISSCCGLIPLTLGLVGRDGGLSTLVLWLQVCCFLALAISAPRMV